MAGIPQHRGEAEEILALRPDLVIHSGLGHLKSLEMIESFGIETIDIGYSESLTHGLEALKITAAALGREARAETLLAEIERRLDRALKLRARLDGPGPRPQALYITPSGITAGKGTYIDEVMRLAGLDNHLDQQGVSGWSDLSIEALALSPPDVVISSFFNERRGWQAAWRFSHHPLTEKLMHEARHYEVPAQDWGCGGFFLVDAVERLLDLRQQQAIQSDQLAADLSAQKDQQPQQPQQPMGGQ